MRKWKIASIILVLFTFTKMYAQSDTYDSQVKHYIEEHKDWAIEEQRRTGVPAAITLAQGIHETSAGISELAVNANNHFGIKCKKEWRGETYTYTDDAPNECFRKYKSALSSYQDHSDYLKTGKRYEALFQLPITDYKGWAKGLKRCGYATNPKYSQILIKLVDDYNLEQYTDEAMHEQTKVARDFSKRNTEYESPKSSGEIIPNEDAPNTKNITSTYDASKKSGVKVGYANDQNEKSNEMIQHNEKISNTQKPQFGEIIIVNGLKAFYARKGSMLLDDAIKNNIRYAKLLELNDLPDAPLEADMFVYLEKKNTKGNTATHLVKQGETLLQISQEEGIQLKWLKFYNRIGGNEEISEGATVQLQQLADEKPTTHPKVVMNEPMREPFAGANPQAIPHGATRMRAGYIRKADIEKSDQTMASNHENNNPTNTETSAENIPTQNSEITNNSTLDNNKQAIQNDNQKDDIILKDDLKKEAIKNEATVTAVKTENIEVAKKELDTTTIKEATPTTARIAKAEEKATPTITEPQASTIVAEVKKEEVKQTVIAAPIKDDVAKKEVINDAPTTEPIAEVKKEQVEKTNTVVPTDATIKEAEKTTPILSEATPANNPIQNKNIEEKESETKIENLSPAGGPSKNFSLPEPNPTVPSKPIEPIAESTKANNVVAAESKETIPSIVAPSENKVVAETTTPKEKIEEKKESNSTSEKVGNYTTIPVAPLAGNNKTKKEAIANNKKPPETEEEPKNEFDRLKAKLDKVVYASDNVVENEQKNELHQKTEEKATTPKEETNKSKYYTVKKGDTFLSITKENKITKHELMTWNKLKVEKVKVGQKLKVKP